jgi:hypothetical protein
MCCLLLQSARHSVHLNPSSGLEAQPSSIYLNLAVYFGTFSFIVALPGRRTKKVQSYLRRLSSVFFWKL